MIFDFSFEQVMRLSSIKRWGIIEMSRDQSVAEHSYNVTMIALSIFRSLPEVKLKEDQKIWEWAVMVQGLSHDLTELVSGDIPTPMKSYLKGQIHEMETELFPELKMWESCLHSKVLGIVKIADYIDAIQFAEKFCVDTRKIEIINEMRNKLNDFIAGFEKKERVPVAQAVEKLWE